MMPPEPDRTWLRNAALLTTAGVILFAVLTVLFIDLITGNGNGRQAEAGDGPPVAVPVEERREGDVDAGEANAPEVVDEANEADAARSAGERIDGSSPSGEGEDSEADVSMATTVDDAPSGDGEADAPERATEPEGASDIAAEPAPIDPALNVPFPDPVLSSTDLETFRDSEGGFFFQLPPGWQRARITPDLDRDPLAADYDMVFESPDGDQRIAVSVWDAAERAAFPAWVMSVAGGMRAVDGEYPTNAFIAGEPALVVGEAESPTSPLRYAAFLAKEDRYVRIAWSAPTGAVRSTDYLRALATFQWPDDASAETTTDMSGAGNQAPPLRLPAGLYFPSDSLFTGAETATENSVDR